MLGVQEKKICRLTLTVLRRSWPKPAVPLLSNSYVSGRIKPYHPQAVAVGLQEVGPEIKRYHIVLGRNLGIYC